MSKILKTVTAIAFTSTLIANPVSGAHALNDDKTRQTVVSLTKTEGKSIARRSLPKPAPAPVAPVSPKPQPVDKRAAVIKTAASLKGIPYRWGGTTKAGFDCSGFTQYVFAQMGVKLPRTTGAQLNAGKRINKRDALPGDLIFSYGTGHVGIVASAGGGTMWHSPTSGKRVELADTRWYPTSYVVRVI